MRTNGIYSGCYSKKYKMGINEVTDSNVISFNQEKNYQTPRFRVKYLMSSFLESPHKKKIITVNRELLVNFSKCHYHWNRFLVCLVFFVWCSLPLKNHLGAGGGLPWWRSG